MAKKKVVPRKKADTCEAIQHSSNNHSSAAWIQKQAGGNIE
jgi:hypothetical protein